MPRLLIFNPETDYALAADTVNYTPPKQVVTLRRKLALTPAMYAEPGDIILLLDDVDADGLQSLPHHELVAERNIRLVTLSEIAADPKLRELLADYLPTPWGWNRQIRHLLRRTLKSDTGLPSDSELKSLRDLSHRRTTLKLHGQLRSIRGESIQTPEEILDTESAMQRWSVVGDVYFKAPWSSSGRGVLFTGNVEHDKVRLWITSVIRQQGSVMLECAYDRLMDCATEWICRDGKTEFLGFSVFETSFRGKYHGNLLKPQQELKDLIKSNLCNTSLDKVVVEQTKAIEHVIAPNYSGPVGIDMLITKNGELNPCVEANLRMTMGMAALMQMRREEKQNKEEKY